MGKTLKKLAPIAGAVAGSFIPGVGTAIGGAIGSAIGGRAATKDAANAQQQGYAESTAASEAATRQANATQKDVYGQQRNLYNEELGRNRSYVDAGNLGQNRLLDVLGLSKNRNAQGYGSANAKFEEQNITMDPGYQFRLQQGQKALERSAAARGGLLSGRAAKDLTDYSQGMASQEYGNAYNRAYGRFQDERRNLLDPLESLVNRGQSATNQQNASSRNFGSNASNYANNVSNNLLKHGGIGGTNAIGAGNARGSGYLGQANTTNKALTSFNDAGGFNKLSGALSGLKNSNLGASVRGFFGGSDFDSSGR